MTAIANHCSSCHSAVEKGDLRCAICGLGCAAREDHSDAQERVQVLRCDECAAAVAYDPAARAPRCAFCHATLHVEAIDDPLEQTEAYVPFSVDVAAARAAFLRWVGSLGFFRPSDLRESASVDKATPLYWVGWLFDAHTLVSWSADSNEGAQRSAWAPHAGQVEITFDNLVVSASRGLTAEEAGALIPGYRLDALRTEVIPDEHLVVEQFDVPRSQARAQVTQSLAATAAALVERQHVPGTRARHVRVAPLVKKLATRRLAFPAYVIAYRYRDRPYRAVLCGQNADLVVGSAPLSVGKIAAVISLGVALLAILAWLIARAM